MKITHIDVTNVLGIRSAAVELNSPITLFCGPNGNGKTSLHEAIRMALGGELVARGVKLKKELQSLVHEGAKSGTADVALGDGTVAFALFPSGKITPPATYTPHAALPFVMEPHRFAALTANERRSVLFQLMGVSMKAEDVVSRLVARGVEKAKADRVGPLLRAGFEAACEEAKRKATEAKGSWAAVAAEAYGSEKAKTWAAPVPTYDAAAAKALGDQLHALEGDLETAQQALGSLAVQQQRRHELKAKLPGLLEQVGLYQRVANKLAADQAGLTEWEQKLQATLAEAGQGKRLGLVHDLAAAVAYLLPLAQTPLHQDPPSEERDAEAALNAYEREYGRIGASGNPEAQAKLPEVQRSRDLMANAVANGQRDLESVKKAQSEAEDIQEELAQPFDEGAAAAAQKSVDDLKAKRAELVKKADAFKSAKLAAEAADKRTKDAAAHHADVEAWTACAQALDPDGIPSELLATALAPFNQRLEQSAADAGWPIVRVTSDMNVETLDGRPYRLWSESEKWRADAMLAEAISFISGLKFLMLDRFDVLDLQGRTDALAWLHILADAGEIDTALVFATLKGIPAGLAHTVTAHWIQGGVIEALAEAA